MDEKVILFDKFKFTNLKQLFIKLKNVILGTDLRKFESLKCLIIKED